MPHVFVYLFHPGIYELLRAHSLSLGSRRKRTRDGSLTGGIWNVSVLLLLCLSDFDMYTHAKSALSCRRRGGRSLLLLSALRIEIRARRLLHRLHNVSLRQLRDAISRRLRAAKKQRKRSDEREALLRNTQQRSPFPPGSSGLWPFGLRFGAGW